MTSPFRLGFPRFAEPRMQYDRDNEAQFRRSVEQLLQQVVSATNDTANNLSTVTATLAFSPDNTIDVGDNATPLRPRTGYFATSVVTNLLRSVTGQLSGNLTVGGTASITGATILQSSSLTINGLAYTWPGSQTANRVLRNTGPGTLAWSQVDLSTDVTGALAGGTVPAAQVTNGTFGAGAYTFPSDLDVTSSLDVVIGNVDTTKFSSASNPLRVGGGVVISEGTLSQVRYGSTVASSYFRANGTLASPTKTASGDTMFQLAVFGYEEVTPGWVTGSKARIQFIATEDWTNVANGTRLVFVATPTGSTTAQTLLTGWGGGTIRIGTSGSDPGRGSGWLQADGGLASAILDSGSGTDLLLKRNAVTQLTLGSSAATFVGTVSATRYTSTQATGTAPFTVASTTKVANLNADLLDDQSGSYYLDLANATGTLVSGAVPASLVTAGTFGTGTYTFDTNLVLSQGNAVIHTGTSDAADSKALFLAGGGAASTTRGAYIGLYGNEYVGLPGVVDIEASGALTLNGGNVTISGGAGIGLLSATTITANLSMAGNITAFVDNNYSFGASGATRFRAAYIGQASVMGRTLTGAVTLADGDCLISSDYYNIDSGGSLNLDGDAVLEII